MAKKTNVFLNDIKNYDLIREMLQHTFLYGNYSKGDLVKNKIAGSERSVYTMINRIKNYLDGNYFTTHTLPNRKQDKQGYRFQYDPLQCPINYLADTYRNCSYVVEDFIFYYILLQSFKPYKNYNPYMHHGIIGYSADVSELSMEQGYNYDSIMSNFHDSLMENYEILQKLGQTDSQQHPDSEALFTASKARDRLHELVDLGIITKENQLYALAPDLLEGIEENLKNLLLMVQFFYNHSDLCIPGYYLAHTIAQYLVMLDEDESDKLFFEQENPVFFYKNANIQNVIDDDTMWSLINAIHKNVPVSFDYKNREKKVHSYTVYPIKIVVERQYGRHYLFAYRYCIKNYILLRIDSISNINTSQTILEKNRYPFLNPDEKLDINTQLHEIYQNHMQNVWNTAASEGLYEILIHFSTTKEDYSHLWNRVRSTGHNGTLTPINDTCFDYRITVNNYVEMKPWIRTFGNLALVDQETSPELFEELKNDYRKACEMYGII